MQDLVDKIEQLRKTLAAMKPKQTNSLVPALKLPAVKPLSMPKATGAKPIDLPGVAPVSGKDPQKMAEQLKNPKPKKPKVEVMKVEKNGQWNLVKGGSQCELCDDEGEGDHHGEWLCKPHLKMREAGVTNILGNKGHSMSVKQIANIPKPKKTEPTLH